MDGDYQGIKEIHIKGNSQTLNNDNTWSVGESDSDSSSQFDKSQKQGKLRHKEVKLDPLLKAVIDIGDQLKEHEKKVKRFEEDQLRRNSSGMERLPSKVSRPKTAVLRYKEPLTDELLSDTSEELVPSMSSEKKLSLKRRPMSAVVTSGSPPRNNLSFSNDQVRKIDLENQRLLKELLRIKPSKECVTTKKGPVRVTSASSINRSKRQQEIEQDNLKFLSRLQNVKATESLSRSTLLNDHTKHKQAAHRISRSSKGRPLSAPTSRTVMRPSSGRNSQNTNISVSTTSSRRSSISDGDFSARALRKLQREQEWNDAW